MMTLFVVIAFLLKMRGDTDFVKGHEPNDGDMVKMAVPHLLGYFVEGQSNSRGRHPRRPRGVPSNK